MKVKFRKSFNRFESENEREYRKERAKEVRREASKSKWDRGFKAGAFGGKEHFAY